MESGQLPKITPQGAQANFRTAIDAGKRGGAILIHRDVSLLRGRLFYLFPNSSIFVCLYGSWSKICESCRTVLIKLARLEAGRKGECRVSNHASLLCHHPPGILKIMSKMGISLLSSYQGAQIFEAVGIGEGLLNLGFKGTPSRLGGLETHDLACETASFMVRFLVLPFFLE